jgi:hypothetical protein
LLEAEQLSILDVRFADARPPPPAVVTATGAAEDTPYLISAPTAEIIRVSGQKWLYARFRVTVKARPTLANMEISVRFTCVTAPTGPGDTEEFDVRAIIPDLYGKLSPLGADAIGQTVDGLASTRDVHTFDADPRECTLTFTSGPKPRQVALGEVCIAADNSIKAGPCPITALRR